MGDKMRLTQGESRACPVTLKIATKHQVCLHRGGVCLHPLWTCPVQRYWVLIQSCCHAPKTENSPSLDGSTRQRSEQSLNSHKSRQKSMSVSSVFGVSLKITPVSGHRPKYYVKGNCNMKKVDFEVKSKVYEKLAKMIDSLEDEKKWYVNAESGKVEEIWATEYAAINIILEHITSYK